ncbi:MAG: peptidyl-prolyl cis-trans isomerase [Candidatus Omnitrophota bacterium]
MRIFVFTIGTMLILGYITGCDQIEKFFAPKVEVKQPAPKPKEIIEEPQGTKLAKVNNKVITYEEFEQNIKNLKALSEEIAIETVEDKKNLLDEMINQELLYQEAKSRGIPTRREIRDLADGYLRGLAVRQLIIDITENVTVDSQEIETFYNQYKNQLTEPEQRRVREIVVSSEYRAKDILISLLGGEDFATVAKEKSVGDTSANAGDAGYIKFGERGEDYRKYDEMAFALGTGETSNVFKGPKGFYLIKVEEIKKGEAKSLTDMWDDVKNTVLSLKQQQRYDDLVTKLKSDAKIEILEELLK